MLRIEAGRMQAQGIRHSCPMVGTESSYQMNICEMGRKLVVSSVLMPRLCPGHDIFYQFMIDEGNWMVKTIQRVDQGASVTWRCKDGSSGENSQYVNEVTLIVVRIQWKIFMVQ